MTDWAAPKFVDLPDLKMAVYEEGEGFPVILCHGWPELGYSWRHQVRALAKAGFRAIAPDLRGYGATGNPLSDKGGAQSVPLYDMPHLCGDLVHLLDALGLEKAVFAGHDWGGIVMWQLPFYHPERVAGLIGVNTPFIPRLSKDPIESMRNALGENMYIVEFQNYGKAEKALEKDIARSMRFLYRKSDGKGNNERPQHKGWENFALLELLQLDEKEWPGVELFNPTDFQYYLDAFTKTGFRGGINWYRNFSRNWELAKDFTQKIDCPSLMISAADDRILSPAMAEGMDKYVSDLERHVIANSGHWTQSEQPDKLSHLMQDWLTRRFG